MNGKTQEHVGALRVPGSRGWEAPLSGPAAVMIGYAVAIGATMVAAGVLYLMGGDVFMLIVGLGILGVVLISLYRLDWGFFSLVGLVLLTDQFFIPGFYPITFRIALFRNLKEIGPFRGIEAAVLNPLELYLILLLMVWFLLIALRRKKGFVGVPVWGSFVLLYVWLGVSFVRGMVTGGDFLPALWEMRALFYLAITYAFVPQILQTRAQVETLLWVCIAAITVKAWQITYRFIGLGFSFGGFDTLSNHEDPVFSTTLIVLLLGLIVFGSTHRQRTVLLALMPIHIIGFLGGQRRAAYGALAVSLIAFFVLSPWSNIRRYTKWIVIAAPLMIGYVAYSLTTDTGLGAPVRLLATSFTTDEEEAGQRYFSNLYRKYEKYDLAVTVRRVPLMGLGFGQKYDQTIKLFDMMFQLRDYIPHNEILWVLVKTGGIGFFLFWFFFNSFMLKGAYEFSRLKDPYLKAVCVMVVLAIINQLVVAYYDLQLTYYRNMVYLGTLMGLLPVVRNIAAREEQSGTVTPS